MSLVFSIFMKLKNKTNFYSCFLMNNMFSARLKLTKFDKPIRQKEGNFKWRKNKKRNKITIAQNHQ